MLLKEGAGRLRQLRDILAVRPLAEQERRPEILERGEFDADRQAGLLDIEQTELPPCLFHFARRRHRPEQRPFKTRIENCGDIPDHADVRLAAIEVPYRGGDRAARPHDPAHFRDGARRVGDEMQDEHRNSAIERIVGERQRAGIAVLEGDARVGVAGAREIEKT